MLRVLASRIALRPAMMAARTYAGAAAKSYGHDDAHHDDHAAAHFVGESLPFFVCHPLWLTVFVFVFCFCIVFFYPDHGFRVKPDTVPSNIEQATGLEREEYLAHLQGKQRFILDPPVRDYFGTKEKPVIIYSAEETRIVGCQGTILSL